MKNRLFKIFGKPALPMLLAGVLLFAGSPVAALAQGHGGHSGGGRSFSGSSRGFERGNDRGFSGGRRYYGGSYYRGRGYYGGGLYLGFGAPYAYGPAYGYGYAPVPAPAPCGYYDQAGYWHANPACYNGTLGY
jgi:hypothetical protein